MINSKLHSRLIYLTIIIISLSMNYLKDLDYYIPVVNKTTDTFLFVWLSAPTEMEICCFLYLVYLEKQWITTADNNKQSKIMLSTRSKTNISFKLNYSVCPNFLHKKKSFYLNLSNRFCYLFFVGKLRYLNYILLFFP